MVRKLILSAAATCLLAFPALAETSFVKPSCIMDAATLQTLPPALILGLLKTEGGRVGSVSGNRNGSVDLGPMQVNDRVWVPVLARMHFNGNSRAAYEALRDNGCYSVHVGAWILKGYVDEAHGDFAEAIGLYNSHNEAPKRAYQRRFAANFRQLFAAYIGGR